MAPVYFAEEKIEEPTILKERFSVDKLDKILHQIKIRLVKEQHHGQAREVKTNDGLTAMNSREPKDTVFDVNEDLKIDFQSILTDGMDVKWNPQVMLTRIDESETNKRQEGTVEVTRSGREIRKRIWPDEIEVDDVQSSDNEMYNGDMDDDYDSDVTVVYAKEAKRKNIKFEVKQENMDPLKEHKCEYCGKEFRRKDTLTRHVKSHLNLREFPCTECDKAFNTKPDLKNHLKIHAAKRVANAQNGQNGTTGEGENIDSLWKHKCEFCGKLFLRKDNLTRHVKSHLNLREFPCTECDKAFNSKPDLKNHLKIHAAKRVASAQNGENGTTGEEENIDSLWKHKCEFCGKLFLKKDNLIRHVQSHLNLREFKCTLCDRAFNSKYELKNHLKVHHDKREEGTQELNNGTAGEEENKKPLWKHKCFLCGKRFKNKNNMTRHVQSHLNMREFKCSLCDKAFNTKPELKYHLKIHEARRTGDTDFLNRHMCQFCGKGFSKKNNLTRHVQSHLNLREFQCAECDKAFNTKPELRMHQKIHAAKREGNTDWLNRNTCQHCGKVFTKRNTLTRHVNSHLNLREFKCSECGKGFNTNIDLKGHQKIHAAKRAENTPGGKPYDCEICGKIFVKSYNLSKHKASHLVVRKFKCEICDGKFKSNPSLGKHMKTHRRKIYPCKHCGKRFWKKYLKQHVRSYCLGNKAYTLGTVYNCIKCSVHFLAPSLLKRHVAEVHEALKMFTCEYCGYSCLRKCNMNRHIDSHLNERRYKCPICDQRFNGKQEIKGHIKAVHDKIRDFTCEVCGKTFARKTTMVYHLKSHSRERVYRCRICGEKFNSTALRKEHMNQSHEKPTFSCTVCGHSFSKKDRLTRHSKRVHGFVIKEFRCEVCCEPFANRKLVYQHMQQEHWQT